MYPHSYSVTQWVGGAVGGEGLLIAFEHMQAKGGCLKVPLSMLFYYSLSTTFALIYSQLMIFPHSLLPAV